LRVSVLAVRPQEKWVARCLVVVFTDTPKVAWSSTATDGIWLGQYALPLSRLPDFAKAVLRGELPARLAPFGDALVVPCGHDTEGGSISGYAHDAAYHYGATELSKFYRYELEWRGKDHLGALFPQPGDSHTWYEQQERIFDALGEGTIPEVAKRLDLVQSQEALYWDRPFLVKIVTPVPIRFVEIRQSAHRAAIEVELDKGRLIDSSQLVVSREQTDSPADKTVAIRAPQENRVCFPAPDASKATFQLSYRGKRIQRETMDVFRPLKANVRYTALQAFEGEPELFAEGFEQVHRERKQWDEDEFERSVSHLLALLGFSVFWWGPHKKSPLKVPDDQADLLAVSADDQLVLVVDCTIEPSQDPKSVKLIRRARKLASVLSKKTGRHPSNVEPVLAVGVERDQVATILKQPADGDEVTVLALDEIREALARIRQGLPHDEIVAALPPAIGSGLQALKPHKLWPGDLW